MSVQTGPDIEIVLPLTLTVGLLLTAVTIVGLPSSVVRNKASEANARHFRSDDRRDNLERGGVDAIRHRDGARGRHRLDRQRTQFPRPRPTGRLA